MGEQHDDASLSGLLQRLDTLNERLKHSAPSPTSASNIRIDAGSVGIWIACTACFCVTLLTVLFAVWAMFEIADLKDTDKLHRAYIDQLQKQAVTK